MDVTQNLLLAPWRAPDLVFGDVLCQQGERLRHVYFPTGGFISLLSHLDDRLSVEVGLIAVEGMLGASITLDIDATCGFSTPQAWSLRHAAVTPPGARPTPV